MRKLALRDEILLQIDKAARYIGGEVNAVMKNKEDVYIRFAMAFPDVYEICMSNLGMMILSRSVHGEKRRSHHTSSLLLNISYKIIIPRLDIPIS